MPIVHIYRAGRKIGSKQFRDMFYIIKALNRDELYWEADNEQGKSRKGGEIQIWILGASASTPKISFVRPDWRLTINDVDFEAKFYQEVDVGGKTVVLSHGDYSFKCQFSSTEAALD